VTARIWHHGKIGPPHFSTLLVIAKPTTGRWAKGQCFKGAGVRAETESVLLEECLGACEKMSDYLDATATTEPSEIPLTIPAKCMFFPVSLFKLTVMSLFTLGLYEIYWFYRNWQLIKAMNPSEFCLSRVLSLLFYFATSVSFG
jgi:hypothetical protein